MPITLVHPAVQRVLDVAARKGVTLEVMTFPDSTHTIQDLCEIGLDRRLLPGEDPDAAFTEIEKMAMAPAVLHRAVSAETEAFTRG